MGQLLIYTFLMGQLLIYYGGRTAPSEGFGPVAHVPRWLPGFVYIFGMGQLLIYHLVHIAGGYAFLMDQLLIYFEGFVYFFGMGQVLFYHGVHNVGEYISSMG